MKRFLSLSLLALSMTAVAQTTPADSLAEVKVNETYLHELALVTLVTMFVWAVSRSIGSWVFKAVTPLS